MRKLARESAFTFIELIVVVSIFLSLLTLGWINFSTLPSKVTLNTSYDLMVSDIKNQQSQAMNGNISYGVHIESDRYILFKGDTYDPNSETNFDVTFENANIEIFNNLFVNQNIIFEAGSGEILNFNSNNSSLTLMDNLSGESKTLNLNIYGAEI